MQMRYELNFDEDKIIDIEAIGDDGVLDLNDCCKIMNEQQAIIQKQSKRIRELESILADDIVRRCEIKEAWKQRIEKRWNDE